MALDDAIRQVRTEYAALLGDLIAEVAAGRGVLAHTPFLKAVVSSPTPQTVDEIMAQTNENQKNTQARIQVFLKSRWLSTGKRGSADVYYIDMPAFLPDRTDRLFDAPGRVGEFKALLAQVEELLRATTGPVKEELEAMQRTLAGIVPPLEARANDLGL